MPNDDYHSHPAAGSTSLKRILRSPAHYKYELENPPEQTPAMKFGTACHQALLEPKLFEQAVIMPKFEGTGSRAARERWVIENHGKLVLTSDQYEAIGGMMRSVSKHKTARSLLAGGAAEEAYFDQCWETGLVRKVKPDFLRKGRIVVDLKTTKDAEPKAFSRQIADLMYHLSGAYYLDVVSAVLSEKYDQFVIIAVEKEPPYGVSVHLLDEATIDAGRYLYKKALKILRECKDRNEWPGYSDQILNTAIPHWAFPAEDVA